jgi:hypothetical protein
MKTIIQTKNEGSKTSFIKKISSLLFLLLVLICFSNQTKAQANYEVTIVNNNSTCYFDVTGFDGLTQVFGPAHIAPSGGTYNTGCLSYTTNSITNIKITCDTRCGTAIFTISGGWAETISQSCLPQCGSGTTYVCTTTTSTYPNSVCGGSTTEHITITIN